MIFLRFFRAVGIISIKRHFVVIGSIVKRIMESDDEEKDVL
ncbi:hypothetical protein Bsel_0867 [[Bacillus] selenitireducens MLS10]|uniref:Uncharacterized protein n=1 Tax=Bacillus selenitireducens (strain ATCC 700615 / DSM 15326 / MLS10) TaxID=439292 RepID=D6XZL7_BACIE|nr:hypothetical protein Bsel_0867 [[Bacillus] selenitireducens MLS10]